MSLVSEALRKARRQPGGEGRHGPGATLPPTLVLPPHRPRHGVSLGVIVAVAIIAGVMGAAGVWWLLGNRHPALVDAQAGPAAKPSAAPASTAPAVPAAAAPPRAAATVGAPPVAAGAAPAAEPAAPPPAAEVPSGHEERPAPSTREETWRERTFLIDADLGYAKLHLDYLVYRPGSPFGRVNGEDVIVGTTVAGFQVEEITADYMKLVDKRHTVILRVR